MSEWISVKDKLPHKAGKYVIFMPRLTGDTRYAVSYYEYKSWGVGERVTHWQPLPPPPSK